AVLALGVAAKVQFVVVESEGAEDGLDDVRGRLVLEDPAVGRPGEEPRPGDHLGAVGPQPALAQRPGDEPADDPVEVTRLLVDVVDGPGHALADDVLGGDRVVFGGQLELVVEQPRHRLGAGEAQQQQAVLAQRRGQRQRTLRLGKCGHTHLPSPAVAELTGCKQPRLTSRLSGPGRTWRSGRRPPRAPLTSSPLDDLRACHAGRGIPRACGPARWDGSGRDGIMAGVAQRPGTYSPGAPQGGLMPPKDSGSVTQWLGALRGGDLGAAQPLWERYFA